jgi:hypothetical protein
MPAMALTVYYRGRLDDLDRLDDLEDRVLDVALELGAMVHVIREASKTEPRRVVRGVRIDLAPGLETVSLLFSPEGWLINLCEVDEVLLASPDEQPWCRVDAQFSSVEGHVALIELLDALKKQYMPDLEVRDEGGYWDSRDASLLGKKIDGLPGAVDGLAEGLASRGLSSDATEDALPLPSRIERIKQQVHQTLARPPEHPPVLFDDDEFTADDSTIGDEAQWDAIFKENRRKQERIHRAIETNMQRGDDTRDAFNNALRDEGIIDLPGEPSISDELSEIDEWIAAEANNDEQGDEPWRESLPESQFEDDLDDDEFDFEADDEDDEDSSEPFRRRRHPLQKQSMDLTLRLHDIASSAESRLSDGSSVRPSNHIYTLMGGAGEIGGGLAQALSGRPFDCVGLCVVQLKRALRGAAFVRSALPPLRAEGVLDETTFNELRETVEQMRADMFYELSQARAHWRGIH